MGVPCPPVTPVTVGRFPWADWAQSQCLHPHPCTYAHAGAQAHAHTHMYTHHTCTHTSQPCEEGSIEGPSSGSFNLQVIMNQEAVAPETHFYKCRALVLQLRFCLHHVSRSWGGVAQRVWGKVPGLTHVLTQFGGFSCDFWLHFVARFISYF